MVRYITNINFSEPKKNVTLYVPSSPYVERQSQSERVLEPSSDNADSKIAGHWHAVVLTYSLTC